MKMLSLLFLGVLSAISCNPLDVQEVISGNNLFAASIFTEISKDKGNENFIVSPFSAHVVLALAQSGGKKETAEEVRNALHLPKSSDKVESTFKSLLPMIKGNNDYSLSTANKIYVKTGFSLNENYKKIATDVYQSAIEPIDFVPDTQKAAQTMNKWVEKKTEGKIQNLVDPQVLDEHTRLVLINALHFKANWSNPFNLHGTGKQNFYKTSKDSVEVDFMRETSYYNYYESPELNAKFLELQFRGGEASFVVILPNEKEGLSVLEKQTEKIFARPQFSSEYVNIHLPKFKISTETEFDRILKTLGVDKIFDEKKADLSGIAGEPGDLYVSKVLQKAFVDVSENGVEAGAATYVAIAVPVSIQINPEPKPFVADHPFIFYIKVKDVILFVGKVASP